jgi:hypothetical protein
MGVSNEKRCKESGYECVYTGSFEDIIRFNTSIHPLPNILSCIFKRI